MSPIEQAWNQTARQDAAVNARIAQLNTTIALETKSESAMMRSIALLTMIFLPLSCVAVSPDSAIFPLFECHLTEAHAVCLLNDTFQLEPRGWGAHRVKIYLGSSCHCHCPHAGRGMYMVPFYRQGEEEGEGAGQELGDSITRGNGLISIGARVQGRVLAPGCR